MKQFLLVAFTLLSFSIFGQRYVLFNPVCMERLKYDASSGYDGADYIVYAIQLSETERLFLEVGKEADKFERRVSRAVITCNSSSINQDMVQQVGSSNQNKHFIVQKEGRDKFRVSPIVSASYIRLTDSGFEYESSDYSFQYSDLADVRQNLASTGDARVFFVGSSNYDCLTGYTFNVTTRQNESTDLTILPEFGVVQFRSFKGNSSSAMSRRLRNVNAMAFNEMVAEVCNSDGFEEPVVDNFNDNNRNRSDDFPTETRENYEPYYEGYSPERDRTPEISSVTASSDYGTIATYRMGNNRTEVRRNETFESRGAESVPAYDSRSSSGVHIVKKQENLYRIAKNYGVKVDDIKRWNNLSDNTIYPGDRLSVSANGAETFTERSVVNTPEQQPSITVSNVEQRWRYTDGYHLVRYGESLSEIAAMYGMTEDRFRYINSLGANEIVPVGYKLKTKECDCEPSSDSRYTDTDNNTFRFDREFTTKDGEDDFSPSVTTPAPYSSNYSTSRSIRYDQPTRWHIVRENETLYNIAKRYNTSVERLRQVNNLDSREVLLPEQTIIVR